MFALKIIIPGQKHQHLNHHLGICVIANMLKCSCLSKKEIYSSWDWSLELRGVGGIYNLQCKIE